MTRLPDLLDSADLAIAELHAAKLDGLVLPLGDAFRPVDRPIGRADRAGVLRRALPGRLIAAEESAAWVWCGGPPPEPTRACCRPRSRTRPPPSPRLVVRELVLAPGEVAELGGVLLTAPLRTACDLAQAASRPAARDALRRMLAWGVAAEDVESLLRARRRVPARAAALAALAGASREVSRC